MGHRNMHPSAFCTCMVMLSCEVVECFGRDMFLKTYNSAGQGGVHRVAIFNAHGAITCIVSQLDVMR